MSLIEFFALNCELDNCWRHGSYGICSDCSQNGHVGVSGSQRRQVEGSGAGVHTVDPENEAFPTAGTVHAENIKFESYQLRLHRLWYIPLDNNSMRMFKNYFECQRGNYRKEAHGNTKLT